MDLDETEYEENRKRYNNENDYIKTLEKQITELKETYLKCSLSELSDKIENLYLEVRKREVVIIDE